MATQKPEPRILRVYYWPSLCAWLESEIDLTDAGIIIW